MLANKHTGNGSARDPERAFTCPSCGQSVKRPRMWVLTAYVKRRSGKTSPMRSLPMDRAAANKEANELRAVGYRVEVEEAI